MQTKLGQAAGGTSFHVHKLMPIFNYAVTAYSTFFGNWDPPFIGPVDAEVASMVAALFKSPCTVRMAICMVHLAASEGQEGCLRVLHELGVSLTVADSDGDTPAHSAVNHGHEECLRVLLWYIKPPAGSDPYHRFHFSVPDAALIR